MLTPEDVVWEPYSPEAVATRATAGLSSHCSANASLWLTIAVLVYDIAVGVSDRDPADDDDDYTFE